MSLRASVLALFASLCASQAISIVYRRAAVLGRWGEASVLRIPLVLAFEQYVIGVDVLTSTQAEDLPAIIPRQGDVVLCYRKWALSKISKDQLATYTDPFSNATDCGRIAGMPNEYVIVGANPLSMTMHLVPPHRVLIAKGVEGQGTHHIVHLGMLKGVAAFIMWPPSRAGPLPDVVGTREDLK